MTEDTELTPSEELPIETAVETPVEAPAEPEETVEDDTSKRLARLAHDAREARRIARQLKAENETLRGQRQEEPNEEIARRARDLAAHEVATREFNATCQTIYKDGVKEYGKAQFDDSVVTMNESLGGTVPSALIEAMAEAGQAHKIWHYLSENTDVLEDMAGLPAHRMGAAVAKLAAKLNAPKAVSKAPAPIRPVGGGSTSDVDLDKLPLSEYMKRMDEHDNRRRHG